jgi:hypothetical protein
VNEASETSPAEEEVRAEYAEAHRLYLLELSALKAVRNVSPPVVGPNVGVLWHTAFGRREMQRDTLEHAAALKQAENEALAAEQRFEQAERALRRLEAPSRSWRRSNDEEARRRQQ